MQLLSLDYGLTLDDILCFPAATAQFDQLADQFAGAHKSSVFEYRWAAMAIRKRARRSKSLALGRFLDWDLKQLPRAIPLARCISEKHEHPGVYLLMGPGGPLYAGATFDVRARTQQILNSESWLSFGPKSAKILDVSEQQTQYGLQSHLIGQLNPVLNSVLLRPEYEAVA